MATGAAAIQGFKEKISIPYDRPWHLRMGVEERKKSQVCAVPGGYRGAAV